MRKIVCIIKYIVLVLVVVIIIGSVTLQIKHYLHPESTPDLFGYKSYVILSGSMRESIQIQDVVIVKVVEEEELEEGDIISFREDDSIVTHRIVRIEHEDGIKKYITKGDYNNTEDKGIITFSDIEGKVVGIIPKIGKILILLQRSEVIIAIGMICLFIFILIK